MNMQKITLLIGANQKVFRVGLKSLLQYVPEFEIIGEANNDEVLVEKAIALKPDIVLTDIQMSVTDGLGATKELLNRLPESKIIALCSNVKDSTILHLLEIGTLGCLAKTADEVEIFEAIQTVYKGKPYFCKEILPQLNEIFTKKYNGGTPKYIIDFSNRERDIMQLICMEYTSKEIADKLYLSKRTVEGHRTKIMHKIGAKSIARIITYSIEYGIYNTAS